MKQSTAIFATLACAQAVKLRDILKDIHKVMNDGLNTVVSGIDSGLDEIGTISFGNEDVDNWVNDAGHQIEHLALVYEDGFYDF